MEENTKLYQVTIFGMCQHFVRATPEEMGQYMQTLAEVGKLGEVSVLEIKLSDFDTISHFYFV